LLSVIADRIDESNVMKFGISLRQNSFKIATLENRKPISLKASFADELSNEWRYGRVPSERNAADWQHDFNESLKRLPYQKHISAFEILPVATGQWNTCRQKDIDHEPISLNALSARAIAIDLTGRN
jgi:hypothetical protein